MSSTDSCATKFSFTPQPPIAYELSDLPRYMLNTFTTIFPSGWL